MLYILIAPSNSGKSYIEKEMVDNYGFKKLITTTTRPVRLNEVDGIDYNFVDEDTFLQLLYDGKFIEHRVYNTRVDNIPTKWLYGTEKIDIGLTNYVTVVDVQGCRELINYYGKDVCKVFYIDTPTELRMTRAKSRSDYNYSETQRRFKADKIDFDINNIKKFNPIIVRNYEENFVLDENGKVKVEYTNKNVSKLIKEIC